MALLPGDIQCVFVCHFHAKRGNILEWSHPSTFPLEHAGVEYKCIPSGAHLVQSDWIFFRIDNLFALSHFRNTKLSAPQKCSDSSPQSFDLERGSRMRAVGLVCKSVDNFAAYTAYLQREDIRHIFESASEPNYEDLIHFLQSESACSEGVARTLCPYSYRYGFPSLVEMFGVNLLVLWKLSLLDLRILFYCAPPMEKLCNQLFPLSHLSHYTHRPALQGSANFLRGDQLVDANEKLQLYVTLFDFSSEDCKLRSERAYFACTSDKVVEENMKGCYDVFVDGNSIRTWRRDLLSVIKPTKADNIRLAELKKLLVFHWESSLEEVHAAFVEYFASLNDRIIHGLVECSQGTWKDVDGDFEEEVHMLRDSEEITSGDVSNMGLMPHNGDMAFVQELAAHFDLDVVFVSEPAGCCPIF